MGYQSDYQTVTPQRELSVTMNKVYGWMTLALAVSALTAYYTVQTNLFQLVFSSQLSFFITIGIELGLVLILSSRIQKLSFSMASLLFGLYSIVNGVVLSSIFVMYSPDIIMKAFVSTAATFGIMSFVGYTTKKDLTGIGSFLFMALIGLIIATLVNMFLRSAMMDYVITYVGLFVFVGLTAYDTQKIKNALTISDAEGFDTRKVAILGALELYLDFINIFLYLLRLFGRRD